MLTEIRDVNNVCAETVTLTSFPVTYERV